MLAAQHGLAGCPESLLGAAGWPAEPGELQGRAPASLALFGLEWAQAHQKDRRQRLGRACNATVFAVDDMHVHTPLVAVRLTLVPA